MSNQTKLFISAYACEPGLGSEIGVGWHWVLELSKGFELWVLTRESNRHSIESWIDNHPEYNGIHFLYFDLPKWARFWKKGLRGVRTYYNLWTRLTNRIVKKTMQENNIHLFHHITYGNALWPVSDYGSRQTFIWGPIGGLEIIPKEYTRHYSFKSKMLEEVRRRVVKFAVRSGGFKNRCKRAELILCKTEDTMSMLPAEARKKAVLFTDVATDNIIDSLEYTRDDNHNLTLIAVGRLDAWRGFDIALYALSEVIKKYPDVRLMILGKGADEKRLRNIISSHGLKDHVEMRGQVTHDEYKSLMKEADVVLNPSLKEGAVTVSFDSMALGKPLVAIDTGGYTRYFKPEYSIVVPRLGRQETIYAFAEAILKLTNAPLRMEMGRAAKRSACDFSWEKHGEETRALLDFGSEDHK